jgi:CTP:phosphocholine cytidylyltransferase-like protein
MINLFIAYDNKETIFAGLGSHIKSKFITNQDYSIIEITHPYLNETHVNTLIGLRDSDIFIFVGYSHGQVDMLLDLKASTASYTSTRSTIHYRNSVFYTFSCLSGQNLADSLISNGSLVFFGYNGEVLFLDEPLFISANNNIINSGLIKLLKGNKFESSEFESAKNEILDTYDSYIESTADLGYIKCWTRNQRLLVKKQ